MTGQISLFLQDFPLPMQNYFFNMFLEDSH